MKLRTSRAPTPTEVDASSLPQVDTPIARHTTSPVASSVASGTITETEHL